MATTKCIPPSMTNELSHLIPGYTAPMRLDGGLISSSSSSSSSKSLSELRKRTSRMDAAAMVYAMPSGGGGSSSRRWGLARDETTSQRITGIGGGGGGGGAMGGKRPSTLPTTFSASSSSSQSMTKRKRGGRQVNDNLSTAGSGWFNMTPTPMSSQLKTDISLIRNRNYLDPKKFYKNADSFDGKVLQLGTVIEGSNEYYTSRLTKRERRMNLTEEIMADRTVTEYAKKKYRELQAEKDVGKGSRRGRGGGGNSGGGNNRGRRKGGGRW